jgi:8-oxo-dGTP pyrophosphatase MutT (NUDIX family)
VNARVHGAAIAVFARLPETWRWRLLRLVVPTFTVGAMAVVTGADGSLLLVRQSYRRGWTMVGGSLAVGEDPATAACREALEEIGVPVELVGEPVVLTYAERRDVHVVFAARLGAGVEPTEVRAVPPEIAEVGWFRPDALPDLHPEAARALVALGRHGPPS